jgi:hypothetical protein
MEDPVELPDKFISVMKDFTNDLRSTFPEHAHKWWVYGEDTSEDGWKDLFKYCLKVYPERFFDILYQNEDVFKESGDAAVDFLPRVDFKELYFGERVTEQIRQTIWKYLQLILFMVLGSVKNKNEFGDTMNMFEGVDETELQEKMADALSNLEGFFKDVDAKSKDDEDSDDETPLNGKKHEEFMEETLKQGEKMMNQMFEEFEEHTQEDPNSTQEPSSSAPPSGDIPNADDLHSHLKGLFGGKLGRLAHELMEELTDDMQETLGIKPEDLEGSANPMDVLKRLMRHPEKMMSLVKKIQNKFQDKMKSGDLSQEDIMKEAGEMLKKMKEMGGNSKQMNEMFQNMAKNMGGSMGKNMKVDTNRLDRMMKAQDTKDRIRAKLEKKKQESSNYVLESKKDPNTFVYRPLDGEAPLKTVLTDDDIARIAKELGDVTSPSDTNKPKKKNKKKNKNKK